MRTVLITFQFATGTQFDDITLIIAKRSGAP
jgi:hypothetical protein